MLTNIEALFIVQPSFKPGSMNVVLYSPAIDILDNVFIFYNFKQVCDAIMVVTFAKEAGSWEKTFIYYSNERWQTESLKDYFDNQKYVWVCKELQPVFKYYEDVISLMVLI